MTKNINSYNEKEIEIQIEVNRNILASASNNTRIIKISSLAMRIEVEKMGLPDKPRANIQIYGLSLELMEELSSLNHKPYEVQNHRISIYAGNSSQNSMNLVFQGELTKAFANFNSIPDVCFEIHAMTGYYPSLIPSFPLSYQGNIPVHLILTALCANMGYSFENKAFFASLKNPILSGSLFEKAIKVAKHCGAELICDNCKFTLLPKYSALSANYSKLSDKNGLLSYPVFDNDGLSICAMYSHDFVLNSLIEIDSIVPKASGLWRIIAVKHVLSAQNQKDLSWFSIVKTVPYSL